MPSDLPLTRRSVILLSTLGGLAAMSACSHQASNASPTTDDRKKIQSYMQSGQPLPAGSYYVSTPLDTAAPHLIGVGNDLVEIKLAAGTFLFDSNQRWSSLHLEGLTVSGGAGVIRNRFSGTNVANRYIVRDCNFTGYTTCAISVEAQDMPYWEISGSRFFGADSASTIGAALSGLSDGSVISDNQFLKNRIHLKIREGGNNTWIRNNDFIQFDPGSSRTAVWMVPAPAYTNSGAGMVLTECKFGNENISEGDLHVLYADESPGSFNGARMPSTSVSKGYISGHTITSCLFAGSDTAAPPAVVSRTPLVSQCTYGPLTFVGTLPDMAVQFLKFDASTHDLRVGPLNFDTITGKLQASNAPVTEG